MNEINRLIYTCAAGLVALLSLARLAHGATIVSDPIMEKDNVWTVQNSPYIIEKTITIPRDVILQVNPGVKIIASSTEEGYSYLDVQGQLSLSGSADSHIIFEGFGGINIFKATTSMEYVDFSTSDGVVFYKSFGEIKNSNFSAAREAVVSESSRVSLDRVIIKDNNIGISVREPFGGAFQVKGHQNSLNGIGGIGNALDGPLAQTVQPGKSSQIEIRNSEIIGNTEASIQNYDQSEVIAKENWWGSEDGPQVSGQNKIIGPVSYAPWLKSPLDSQTCCSSVIFIPGLEASRLYLDNRSVWGFGTSTNQLWEPNRNADVSKLFLDQNGLSLNSSIYSGDPIDSACFAGICKVGIYKKFIDTMNEWVGAGSINEWRSFGYDWRKSISDLVLNGTQKKTTFESLIDLVKETSKNSKTGKVTIIAHSNGGLLAKYLVRELSLQNKEDLIDKIISVAVPYLGTPQAIAALLHGDGQSIMNGFLLKKSVARELGRNMPSAYSLLPGSEYFKNIFSPTIAFASTTIQNINDGSYPIEIGNYADQYAYIANSSNSRRSAETKDTSLPINGNSKLLAAAESIRFVLDNFSWPTNIVHWSILGWNAKTTKGIYYREIVHCYIVKCSKNISHEASTTLMGDGTVLAKSAAYDSKHSISVDLGDVGKNEDKKYDHSNILESDAVNKVVNGIVHSNTDSYKKIEESIKNIPGVALGEPDYENERSYLILATHSPVELHVYDETGRHTGPIDLPQELMGEDSVFSGGYESKIPGSDFDNVGGTDENPEYQIYLPYEKNHKYSIVINGTGVGVFTFDMARVTGGSIADRVQFVDVPVTPLTVATSTLILGDKLSYSKYFASSSLSLDVDGDGSTDMEMKSTDKIDINKWLKLLKASANSSSLKGSKSSNIIKRIIHIEEMIKSGKYKGPAKMAGSLEKRVRHMKPDKLSSKEKNEFLSLLDKFIDELE